MAECQSSATHRTFVVPMLLFRLSNWTVDGQNQNIHCKQVWVAVAMVVAVEILAAAKKGVSPSIGIGGFLLAPLNALEAFLKRKLQIFVGAFAPWFGIVGERRDALLASDLMQGGVEKIKEHRFKGLCKEFSV